MVRDFADWRIEPSGSGNLEAEVIMRGRTEGASVRFPVAGRAEDGRIAVAATEISGDLQSCCLTVGDDDRRWSEPQQVPTGTALPNLRVGALSCTHAARWVLAGCAWEQQTGMVERSGEDPPGVNTYRWSGFRCRTEPFVLLSDDCRSWSEAAVDPGPFLSLTPCGRIVERDGLLLLPAFGPTSTDQMDACLSDVGLLASQDAGETWRVHAFVARSDPEAGVAWESTDVTVLSDGTLVSFGEGHARRYGDFTRPRICRCESAGGVEWSKPEHQLLGPAPTVEAVGGDRIIAGTWYEAGLVYNVSADRGKSWICQGLIWDCIWYAEFPRGGLKFVKLGEDRILCVFHWGSKGDIGVSEIKAVNLGKARP